MKSHRFFALTVLLLGMIVGMLVPVSANEVVGSNVRLPAPGPQMQLAIEGAPYHVREPKYLPDGLRLYYVSYAPPGPDEVSYAVDLWYRAEDGDDRFVHIWQTNNEFLGTTGKDPLDPEKTSPTDYNGRTWARTENRDLGVLILNRRLSDGVIISIDSNISFDELVKVADSIEE